MAWFRAWFEGDDGISMEVEAGDGERRRFPPGRVPLVAADRSRPPGWTAEAILVIEHFKAEWREKYLLAEPLELPSGTELFVSRRAVLTDFIVSSAPGAQ